MGYLEEFQAQISSRNFSKFLQLWEEYCTSDSVDTEEFAKLLNAIRSSDFAKSFGQLVEMALPLWRTIEDPTESYQILKLLLDLQTTNSSALQEVAFEALKQKYPADPLQNERFRLVGLRGGTNFQGALSHYDLLAHMEKGNYVFHQGGWGTGEILDVSPLREQVSIEFENLSGNKHLTFSNAFKTLVLLEKSSFLARRFGDADNLEKEAKKEIPAEVIKLLLKDLGPKTAAEIKDELCDLVIPEKEWVRWWQNARTKLKKDTLIESPKALKDSFSLRSSEILHEERLVKAIQHQIDSNKILLTSYNFVRDFPTVLKNVEIKHMLESKLGELLEQPDLTKAQELQAHIFLEQHLGHKVEEKKLEKAVQKLEDVTANINEIEILSFKKRALILIRNYRKDWAPIFLELLFSNQQGSLREYIFKELHGSEENENLQKALTKLLHSPQSNPDMFYWYFQSLLANQEKELPFSDKEGICQWFEGFLILFHFVEFKPEYRELTKKIYSTLSGKRYAVVRQIIEGSSFVFIQEFLLLVSKCHSLTDTDLKILRSLAAVVHPSLNQAPIEKNHDPHTLWTTEEGYHRTQERIRHIGTTEVVANAREIEAARALGDLRENSEYKFALEKRSRLQGELKSLSEQLHHARIITKQDVSDEEVGVGSVVHLLDSEGNKSMYTILGPWDADPAQNILSFQSKFAQSMVGCKKETKFSFRENQYTVVDLQTIFD